MLQFGQHVLHAMKYNLPVIALESTIITHGMPYPHNFKTALKAEDEIKKENVIPATIGIIKGQLKVGLELEDFRLLANEKAMKVSKRDLGFCMANKLNGGTTVAATMYAAGLAGIKVFATGGLGGVHRGQDMDISGDLPAFQFSNVAVVSSGIKSILDIPRSLEYLETLGVPVVTIGTSNVFPGFYTKDSGYKSPFCEHDIEKCAKIAQTHFNLNLKGILFTNPIPSKDSFDNIEMENAINESLSAAERNNIKGKEITPYLLGKINEITKDRSLKANTALYLNNVKVGAKLAKSIHLLNNVDSYTSFKALVIGGINLDMSIKPLTTYSKSSNPSHIKSSIGGVGYNIYKSLSTKIDTRFLSYVGDDFIGESIQSRLENDKNVILKIKKANATGAYIIQLNANNDINNAFSDVSLMEKITYSDFASHFKSEFDFLCCDANLSSSTLLKAFTVAKSRKAVTIFEPISINKCKRAVKSIQQGVVDIICPNHFELQELVKQLSLSPIGTFEFENKAWNKYLPLACALSQVVQIVLAKFGKDGMCLVMRTNLGNDNIGLHIKGNNFRSNNFIGAICKSELNSVPFSITGAGDAAISELIAQYSQLNTNSLETVLKKCSEASAAAILKNK